MNALRVETCMLYMYFKETSLISHASLESSNKESINQSNNPKLVWTTQGRRIRVQGCQPFQLEILNTSSWDTDFGLKIHNKILIRHKIQISAVEYRSHLIRIYFAKQEFF